MANIIANIGQCIAVYMSELDPYVNHYSSEAAHDAEGNKIAKRRRGGGRGHGRGRGRGRQVEPAEVAEDDPGEPEAPKDIAKGEPEAPKDLAKASPRKPRRAIKLLKQAAGSKDKPAGPGNTKSKRQKVQSPSKMRKVSAALGVLKRAEVPGLDVPATMENQQLAS